MIFCVKKSLPKGMANKMAEKKKWYDTWWGSLWTLAMIDANPGRGMRTFMEVDEALQDMVVEDEPAVNNAAEPKEGKRREPCPSGAVCTS
jgi:hypothetical protein